MILGGSNHASPLRDKHMNSDIDIIAEFLSIDPTMEALSGLLAQVFEQPEPTIDDE